MALPLNKSYPDGRTYSRPKSVEEAIDSLLLESVEALCGRAEVPNRDHADYIASESLVHLVREARRQGDDTRVNALLPLLFARCYSNLLSKISMEISDAETLREEILCEFADVFATDGRGENPHQLDFFEVRFNQAFRAFRIDYLRREMRRREIYPPVPVIEDKGDEAISNDGLAEFFQTPPNQRSDLDLRELYGAIDKLPPDERKAVALCHIVGYEMESVDPEKRTAATICGVTGKTIQNRLGRAAQKLLPFKENVR
ncbi:MAG: hypothetical protein WBO10_04015 [Pyrinomonadaceae bacterium]